MLTPAETGQRQRRIEALADKIDALAKIADRGPNAVGYQDFEPILRDLHQAGSFPEAALEGPHHRIHPQTASEPAWL
jgi:hypothetical protein